MNKTDQGDQRELLRAYAVLDEALYRLLYIIKRLQKTLEQIERK